MKKIVAFIPVRGGSKSIPQKNIKELNGKPLVYWVILAAQQCKQIQEIYVSTDSQEIKTIVEGFQLCKVKVIDRSEDTASDSATTESAMLEFATHYQFDTIILIQATSPLLQSHDLEKGLNQYQKEDTDSVLSAVRQKRFVWSIDSAGVAKAENYDIYDRPRRQEMDGYFVENGAFYITSRKALLETHNRISGKIRITEMPEESYYEIDEPFDWKIVEQLMKQKDWKYNL